MNPEDKGAADDITEQITGGCFPIFLLIGLLVVGFGAVVLVFLLLHNIPLVTAEQSFY